MWERGFCDAKFAVFHPSDFALQNIDVEGFFGLVVIAQVKHPVPSRTRQLSTAAPMVLRLKAWESRSLPNLKSSLICISLSMLLRLFKP